MKNHLKEIYLYFKKKKIELEKILNEDKTIREVIGLSKKELKLLGEMYEKEQIINKKKKGVKRTWGGRKGKLYSGEKRVFFIIYQLRNNLPYRQLKTIFGFKSPSVVYYRFIEGVEIVERILKKFELKKILNKKFLK